MNWNEIKNNPARLQELVDKHGVRGLARKVGVSHPTIINYQKKHGLKEVEGKEEIKPAYEKTPDGYIVRYGKGRKVAISEEKLDELLSLYCVAKLTINQVAIQTGLTRQEVYAIKTAFSITKDSQPFTPEQVDSLSAEELAEKMRTKKLRYSLQKYEANKYADIERRVKQMDKANYWYSELCKRVNKIAPKAYTLRKPTSEEESVLVAYVADVHGGLEVDNYFNTYNIDVMHERFARLANEIACAAESKVYIADLGDSVHGTIHGSTKKHSVWVLDAVMEVVKAYEQLFVTLLEQGFEVYFSKVNGNHESIERAKTDRTEEENYGNTIYSVLKWKYSEQNNLHFIDQVKGINATILPIFDYGVLTIHGDNMSIKAIDNIDRFFRPYNIKEVSAGHIHRLKVEDVGKLKVHYNECFCGPDQYASNKGLVSDFGVRLVNYTKQGRSKEYLLPFSKPEQRERLEASL